MISCEQCKYNLNSEDKMKKIINICSAIFMIANVLLSLWFYFTTDEIYVPAHWSFGGNVDRYGQTWLILPLSGTSVGVYLLLLYCQKHGIANLPFAIINKVKTKPIISHMIAWVTFLITLTFLYVVAAVAQLVPLHNTIIYLILLVIIAVIYHFTMQIYKVRK